MPFVLHTVKWSKSSIWPIDRSLWGTTTLGQSGSERKGDEVVLHVAQSSCTAASQSDELLCHI